MSRSSNSFSLGLGAAFAIAALSAPLAAQAESVFSSQALSQGYQLAENDAKMPEGKCGEGKCGADKKADKKMDGKCGEGKCGAAKPADKKTDKKMDGKCGEGKCGAAKK